MIKQRRRRKILGFLVSGTRFSMGFLSNLTPNLEKFSAFGEIASLKKHYEKFTIKNTPLYSDLGEYRGVFLIVKFCSPKNAIFGRFRRVQNFGFFFIRFFSHDDFLLDEIILYLFLIWRVDFDRFLCFCSKF